MINLNFIKEYVSYTGASPFAVVRNKKFNKDYLICKIKEDLKVIPMDGYKSQKARKCVVAGLKNQKAINETELKNKFEQIKKALEPKTLESGMER